MAKNHSKKRPGKKLTYTERSELVAKERRRRPVMRKVMLAVRIVLALLLLGITGWMAWTKQYEVVFAYAEEKFFAATSLLGLNLENVFVSGSEHISDGKIIATLMPEDAKATDHYPLFALSIPAMKGRLKKLGWVADADIERQLPNALHVRITERVPVAIWQRGMIFTLVDKGGVSISEQDVKFYPTLPVMVGADAPEYLGELYTQLEQQPQMLKGLQSLVRVGGRRWDLHFKNGIELKLPEENIEKAFATLLSMQKEKQILERAVKVIDLRDAERVYVLPETQPEKQPQKTE